MTSLDSPQSFQEAMQMNALNNISTQGRSTPLVVPDNVGQDFEQLRQSTRTQLSRFSENKRQRERDSDSEDDEENDQTDNQDEAGARTTLSTEEEGRRQNPFGKGVRPRKSRLLLDFVYLNRNLKTEYLIETDNNLNYGGFRATYRKNMSDTRGDDLVVSLMRLSFLELGNIDFDVPGLMNVHVHYLKDFRFFPLDIIVGTHYDTEFFINLPELNAGLQVAENKFIWGQIGLERTFNLGFVTLSFQGLYAQTILSSSDFIPGQDITLDGTRLNLGTDIILGKIRFGVHYSNESFTSPDLEGFSVDQNSFFLSAVYDLL